MTEIRSQSKNICFGSGLPVLRIGERINPTGKPAIQKKTESGDLAWIEDLAAKQEAAGASVIGVNLGMPGIDESSLLVQAVKILEKASDLPLYIDSSLQNALIAAIKVYPHKALVGSATGEEKSYKPLIDFLKNHPAALVVMLNDEKGIPTEVGMRIKIAEKVLAYAAHVGFPADDLVFDCLAMSVGADPEAAVATLDCIKILSSKLGISTIIGLSNVSFGLPERIVFNRTFGAVAVNAGLSAVIFNPNSLQMVETLMASDVLSNHDPFAMNYLEFYRRNQGNP